MKIVTGIVLLVCAYALLYPGLTEPMLTVSGTVEKVKLVEVGKELIQNSPNTPPFVNSVVDMVVDSLDVTGNVQAFDKTRSILGTAKELHANNHMLVAMLIVVFSVIVPLIKAVILSSLLLPFSKRVKRIVLWLSNGISKWSMADVFVIAIFIAYLAGNGIQESRALVEFEASLGKGFWFFLSYCLLSILGTQLLSSGLGKPLSLPDSPNIDEKQAAELLADIDADPASES